jgi:hypothetical protein
MLRFKIGDLVIGNQDANTYGTTIQGWKGKVVDVAVEGNEDSIKVQGIAEFHEDDGDDDGEGGYTVNQNKFDLYKPANNISEIAKQLKRKGPKKDYKVEYKVVVFITAADEEHAEEIAKENEQYYFKLGPNQYSLKSIEEK